MNIECEDLAKLEKIRGEALNKGGIIYRYNNDILFKVVGDCFEKIERNIDIQIKEHIPNTPFIYDKLYNKGSFIGYSMEYLKNSITMRSATKLNIDFDSCVKIIQDIYETVKYLHKKDLLLGDVHMDNFMIDDKGRGYVIDLDGIFFSNEINELQDLYSIKLKSDGCRIAFNNKKTDNIKTMICCLSLILGVDLESEYINKSEIDIEKIYNKYIKKLGIRELDNYFYRIINGEDIEYFDDFLRGNYYNFYDSEKVRTIKK